MAYNYLMSSLKLGKAELGTIKRVTFNYRYRYRWKYLTKKTLGEPF